MKTIAQVLIGVTLAAAPIVAQTTSRDDLTLRIIGLNWSGGTIVVEFENHRPDTIRIWEESNSWGSGHWRVLIMRNGTLMSTLVQRPKVFTRNGPEFDNVAGGSSLKRQLDLSEFDSVPIGKKRGLVGGDVVIVVYDCPRPEIHSELRITVDIAKLGVWHGVVAASKIVE